MSSKGIQGVLKILCKLIEICVGWWWGFYKGKWVGIFHSCFFYVCIFLMHWWESPSYNFLSAMWGQSSPSNPTPFPCTVVPNTIQFIVLVTFFGFPYCCALLNNNSLANDHVPLISPLRIIRYLVDWNNALTISCKVTITIFVLTFGPFPVD